MKLTQRQCNHFMECMMVEEETVWIFKESCAKQWSREIGISPPQTGFKVGAEGILVPSAWLEGVHSMSQNHRPLISGLALLIFTYITLRKII